MRSLDLCVSFLQEPLLGLLKSSLVSVLEQLIVASNSTESFLDLDEPPVGGTSINVLGQGEQNFHRNLSNYTKKKARDSGLEGGKPTLHSVSYYWIPIHVVNVNRTIRRSRLITPDIVIYVISVADTLNQEIAIVVKHRRLKMPADLRLSIRNTGTNTTGVKVRAENGVNS